MSSPDDARNVRFDGSIPAVYDRCLGPVIFAPYATEVAARVAATAPARVLETAAGTGRLTRVLAAQLPRAVLVATDLNQPMLDYAAAHSDASHVVWRQADAQALPFDGASFDAVVTQFGAMFFPDKPRAFAEARRVLAPGGRFVFSVWGPLETSDFATVVMQTVAARFGDEILSFLRLVPHGYHDQQRIRSDLGSGGFHTVTIEDVWLTSRASSPALVATGYCEGTPLRNELESRHPGRLAEATAAATAALAARFGDGAIEGRMQALIVTATP